MPASTKDFKTGFYKGTDRAKTGTMVEDRFEFRSAQRFYAYSTSIQTLWHGGDTGMPVSSIVLSFLIWYSLQSGAHI